jgi:hypothetical protein
MGAALRVLGRGLASPLIGERDRTDWGHATTAYARALRALEDVESTEFSQMD